MAQYFFHCLCPVNPALSATHATTMCQPTWYYCFAVIHVSSLPDRSNAFLFVAPCICFLSATDARGAKSRHAIADVAVAGQTPPGLFWSLFPLIRPHADVPAAASRPANAGVGDLVLVARARRHRKRQKNTHVAARPPVAVAGIPTGRVSSPLHSSTARDSTALC